MNTTNRNWTLIASFFMILFISNLTIAQTFNVNNKASNLKIEGTSNIHDWTMDAKDFQGNIKVQLEDGQLVKVDELNFAVVAESLESGKSGMDKNAYKALDTGKHQRITYQLQQVENLDCTSKTSCKILTKGVLTIAGTKRTVDLVMNAKISGDKIVLSGNKKIKMTDFKVDPPKAMFGTITTGDEINIVFEAAFVK